MTEKERELIDAGVEYAKRAKNVLLGADDHHAIVLASRVLDASTAVLDDRITKAEAPLPVTTHYQPRAGEILHVEARASWARGCAACALGSIDIAHTCGDS